MNRKNILLASLAAGTLGRFAWANAHSSPAQQEYFAVNSSGVSEAALRGAIDPLFEEASMGETRALLVMKDGEIIAERYGAGFDSESRPISWSIAKSITAVLAGLMVSDGRLVLDAPAPVPAGSQPADPRGEIERAAGREGVCQNL